MAPELTEAPLPYANPTHALRKSYAQNGIQVMILWDKLLVDLTPVELTTFRSRHAWK